MVLGKKLWCQGKGLRCWAGGLNAGKGHSGAREDGHGASKGSIDIREGVVMLEKVLLVPSKGVTVLRRRSWCWVREGHSVREGAVVLSRELQCQGKSWCQKEGLNARGGGCDVGEEGLDARPGVTVPRKGFKMLGKGSWTGQGVLVPARGYGAVHPAQELGEIAFLAEPDSGQPESIFGSSVVSWWRGMLQARLLPAPFAP